MAISRVAILLIINGLLKQETRAARHLPFLTFPLPLPEIISTCGQKSVGWHRNHLQSGNLRWNDLMNGSVGEGVFPSLAGVSALISR
jgi:hypothetical protein